MERIDSDDSVGPETQPLAVFVYIPNLIGLTRVALLVVSFFFMAEDAPQTVEGMVNVTQIEMEAATGTPKIAMFLYFLSAFLDAFDGMAARAFNQESKVGGLLDMLTDRVGTAALIMGLCSFGRYKSLVAWFQCIVCLDIVAHWAHLHQSNLQGGRHHKAINLEESPILFFYYKRPVLFLFCAANELVFVCMFLMNFQAVGSEQYNMLETIALPCGIIAFIKNIISVVHLFTAFYNIAIIDVDTKNE